VTATLTVLGAGSILPRAGYGCAAYALRARPGGPVTLLDCGPGTIRNLAAAGIAIAEIERVVFSHYHLDHCLDLFALAFARHNPTLASAGELELVGPRGLARLVEAAPAALGRWAAVPRSRVTEVELDGSGRSALERGELAFTCRANGHTPEAVSWRVEPRGGAWALTYTGDTPPDARVAELARASTLFLAECSFPDEAATPNHLTPGSAAELARAADVERLVLTHFYPSMDPLAARARAAEVYRGPIELARDGLVLALG